MQTNIYCNGDSSGSIDVTATGNALAYYWAGPNDFASSNEDINKLIAATYHLQLTSNNGCAVDTTITITQPLKINTIVSFNAIVCKGSAITLTISAAGGYGNYMYSLMNGNTTTGPQQDNHFVVKAGNYTIKVTDGYVCSVTSSLTILDGNTSCNRNVSESNSTQNVTISPNPAKGYFKIKLSGFKAGNIHIKVSALNTGRSIYSGTIAANTTSSVFVNATPGIYSVELNDGVNTIIRKLTIIE